MSTAKRCEKAGRFRIRDSVAYYESIARSLLYVQAPWVSDFRAVSPSQQLWEVGESQRDFHVEGGTGHLPQLTELLQGAIYRNHYREGVSVYACLLR